MFCNQCGASQPEGSKFCSTCGADLTAAPAAAPATPKPQPATPQPAAGSHQSAGSKPPKKKTPIWLTAVIVLAAFLLGKFVIAPSMLSEPDDSSDNSGSQIQQTSSGTETESTIANPAYDAVFEDTYIVHFQMFFNMDTASFVKELENGTICCSDYGYQDDVVIDFVETMYIPVSEYTDDQKTEVESSVKASLSAVEALACCSVKYNMSVNYLTVTISYSSVDKAENYTALYNANILTENTFISMSETEKILLNDGFIKK